MSSRTKSDVVEIHLDCEGQAVHLLAAQREPLMSESVVGHGSVDDPATWVAALEAMADDPDFDQIVAEDAQIRIRASEVGMVVLDDAGLVIHPILWAHDARSNDDATWCRKKFDDSWWESEVGLVPESRHLVTKLSWLHRSEADVWNRLHRICSLEDFVVGRVIGASPNAPIISRPDVVAEFAVWSPTANAYSAAVLGLIDSEREWTGVFPDVAMVTAEIGTWRTRRISN